MHKILSTFIIALVLLAPASAQVLIEKRSLNFWTDIGQEIFEVQDYDMDGEMEFLSDANERTQIIIGRVSESGLVKSIFSSRLFGSAEIVRYVDTDSDSTKELYVFDSSTDTIHELSVPGLETIASYHLTIPTFGDFADMQFGSFVAGEEPLWCAITAYNGAYSFSTSDFSDVDTLPEALEGRALHLGNFDGDPDLEIFVHNVFNTLYILNHETYAVEHQVEDYTADFTVNDLDSDGVLEVIHLSSSHELSVYDFSKEEPRISMTNVASHFDLIFVTDFDSNGIKDIVLYDESGSNVNILILDGETLDEIWETDVPWGTHNVGGRILGIDNFYLMESNHVVFSDGALHSLDLISGLLEKSTINFSNIAISAYDYFLSSSQKHLILQEIESSSGADALRTTFMDFETGALDGSVNPALFEPEALTPQINSRIGLYRPRSSLTKDLAVLANYPLEMTLYNPIDHEIYFRGAYRLDNFMIVDVDGDGYEEIIDINRSANEIVIYGSESKYDWKKELTIISTNDKMGAFQLDGDEQLELMLFDGPQLKISDTKTGVQEVLDFHSPLAIESIDIAYGNNGSASVVMLLRDSLLIYNIESQTVTTRRAIENYTIDHLAVVEMYVDSVLVPFVVTYGEDLSIYNGELELVDSIPAGKQSWPDVSKMILHQHPGDPKPSVIVSFKYGVKEYQLDLPGVYYEYFDLWTHYPHQNDTVPPSSTFFIGFSEPVESADILNNVELIAVSDSSMVGFDIQSASDQIFEITPHSMLEEDSEMKLVIKAGLTSKRGHLLDFRRDHHGPGAIEDQEIDFVVKSSSEAPVISLVSDAPAAMYKNTKRQIRVALNSSSDGSVPMRRVQAGFEASEMKEILPIDKVYDESTETVEVLIDCFGKEPGSASFQVVAENYSHIWDTLTIQFTVLEEQGIPFKRDGGNQYNTFHQARDTINNKIIPVWAIDLPHRLSYEHRVVGEGDFLYMTREYRVGFEDHLVLNKLHKETGALIYQKVLGIGGSIGNPILDRGYLYFQVNTFTDAPMFTCVDALVGDVIWQTEFRNQHVEKFSPVVTDDYVLMAGGEFGGVYCFDRWTGKELWFQDLDIYGEWTPSIYDSTVVVNNNGEIIAHELGSGSMLWSVDLMDSPSFANSSPIIDTINKQVIFNNDEEIIAFSIETQEQNWSLPVLRNSSNMSLAGNSLFYKDREHLKKINATTGVVEKAEPTPDSRNDLFTFGNLIFTNGTDGTFIYDTSDLDFRGHLGMINHQMSIIDDFFVAATSDTIYGFMLADQCFDYSNIEEFICFGDTLQVVQFTYTEPGSYTDTIMNHADCDEIFTLDLEVAEEVVIMDTIIEPDNGTGTGAIAVFLSGGTMPYTYVWSNGQTSQYLENLMHGEYSLTVFDADGCSYDFVFEVPLASALYSLKSACRIYPNILRPGGMINIINSEYPDIFDAVVYNIAGQMQTTIRIKANSLRIPNTLAKGWYFLEVRDQMHNVITASKIVLY